MMIGAGGGGRSVVKLELGVGESDRGSRVKEVGKADEDVNDRAHKVGEKSSTASIPSYACTFSELHA